MINEIIEQIGGRERLEAIVYAMGAEPCDADPILDSVTHGDIGKMARALLAVLDAKPVGVTISPTIAAMDGVSQVGIEVYTIPPAASVPDGWLLIPAIPSQSHLNSIAMRYRHDFYLLPDTQRESVLSTARQMYEECSGQGFYSIPKPAAPVPGGE